MSGRCEQSRPRRIQRKRLKGWRLPPNTVAVGRPGRWGNPYEVPVFGLARALRLFNNTARGIWDPAEAGDLVDEAYTRHCAWVKRLGGFPVHSARRELGGKHLACWCPVPPLGDPDDQCHAAILIAIANT